MPCVPAGGDGEGGGGALFVPNKPLTNKQTFMQVLLAKHKADSSFYAVKVLQKKVILKKKEVGETKKKAYVSVCFLTQSFMLILDINIVNTRGGRGVHVLLFS